MGALLEIDTEIQATNDPTCVSWRPADEIN